MKTILQLSNIHKMYGTQTVLDGATVSVSEGQKIGVIGRNGAGKSTLCKIITGHETADSGSIETSNSFKLAFLEQHDVYKLDETVEEFLMRYTGKENWECGKVAAKFQLKNELLDTKIGALSGGYRTRVKLASMLLKDPNFLILDEPTNYLDLRTLILLEEFLQEYKGGFFVVSHDREFLRKTCEHTLEVEKGGCTLYPGSVDQYLIFKEEQREVAENYNKNIEAKQRQLKAFVDRFRAKASKATQAKSKQKQLERLHTIEIGHPLGNVKIRIPQVAKRNAMSFSCRDLSIGYPERVVAKGVGLEFRQGDHVAILGDNGQGKTTFMRTIAEDLKAISGSFKWGYDLKIAYYAQHVFSSLNPDHDVYGHLSFMASRDVTRQEILDLAGSFLFRGSDVEKKVTVLSGGEKARLCLAGLLLTKSEILLLDEPTNHLDFETVEALGAALKAFHGTVFFISHDRTFVNMLATQIVEVKDGKISGYPGSYEDYVYSVEQRLKDEFSEDNSSKPKKIETKYADKKASKQLRAEKVQLNAKIRNLQKKIEEHKKERDEIHLSFMNDADSWSVERNQRYEYLENMIRKEEDEWIKLAEEAEALDSKI
ncbi:MAG: ABC-F family ATP-binding cassette domain-containing protein [Candidatus Omnitrophica bacterium]|nr:ABC-F family ATP-binding cassette domain-containing protein [Candidatus Omnitrophota bacterium]